MFFLRLLAFLNDLDLALLLFWVILQVILLVFFAFSRNRLLTKIPILDAVIKALDAVHTQHITVFLPITVVWAVAAAVVWAVMNIVALDHPWIDAVFVYLTHTWIVTNVVIWALARGLLLNDSVGGIKFCCKSLRHRVFFPFMAILVRK